MKNLLIALFVLLPTSVFAGFWDSANTDVLYEPGAGYGEQINAYYDLRNRKTYIQISNTDAYEAESVIIHVQIFQHDRDCDELNFFDTLTNNDTVIYDLDNIVRNDGSAVNINLLENSYGYVVVTAVDPDNFDERDDTAVLIGNFRIIDNAGYEYRTNMQNSGILSNSVGVFEYWANFNNVDGANQADIVGFVYGQNSSVAGTVVNGDDGVDFSIFVFDLDEEPISCDQRNFACGNIMNYGVNDDYGNSRTEDILCEGASLPDPNGGTIFFTDINTTMAIDDLDEIFFAGYIGINNGDTTGSMDGWFGIAD